LNPVWNEEATLQLSHPASRVLIIQVWDKDSATKADSLGIAGVTLGLINLKQGQSKQLSLTLYYQAQKSGKILIEITALDFDIACEDSSYEAELDMSHWSQLGSSRSLKSILTNSINSKEDKHLDDKFGVLMVDDVYDDLQTGDVLIHSGNGTFSMFIQLALNCMWSHVSMLIKNPSERLRRAYNIPEDAGQVFVFEVESETIDRREGGGVQLTELRYWMEDYYKNDPRDFCAIRRLHLPNDESDKKVRDISKIEDWMIGLKDSKYEQHKFDLVKCIFKKNKKSDTSSLFCSEIIAAIMVQMGMLPHTTITSNYSPKDFASSETSLATVLLQGARYATEKRLRLRLPDVE
jgi:hypothetical protein